MAAELVLPTTVRTRKRRRHHCSCLFIFLWIYLILFVVGCIILVVSVFEMHTDSAISPDLRVPYPHYYRLSSLDRRHFEVFGWPFKQIQLPFNCSLLSDKKNLEYITSGWTKSVSKYKLNNNSFALKTVNPAGEDVRRCSEKESLKMCFERASSKLLKEFIVLRELQHSNIVQVVGWCITDDNVAMVMELCSPINTVSLLRMSFIQRLKISMDLARLVYYLSSTPLGSISLNDFRREQFVLCGETLKVTDLDDIGIDEPRCRHQQDCTIGWCTGEKCRGHNELRNVQEMFSQFFNLILAFETPKSLHLDLTNLLLGPKQWDSFFVLKLLERIYSKFCIDNKDCI